ncbi:DUF2125 domain-containing protein [Mesorhizobium sp. KR9-304]|uniref:DUF2125 domain-containing protein n=1 Tax=Mesorhizobium sp. KR9-304 TaxID=3156614 RepID=UPI0032B53D40
MTVTEDRTPNYGRRILWLAVFAAVLFGGYSAGWFYLADRLATRAKAAIAEANRDGITVECDNTIARGFPFRLGVYCDRIAYADAAEAVGLTAGNLRTAGQVYDPLRFVAELDGPAMVATPRNGSFKIDWEKLRASVRWARPLPERVSVEGGGVAATTANGAPLATIGAFEAHMRPNGQDLDLASSFEGLALDPALADGRKLPALSGESDLTIDGGVDLRGISLEDLRGRSGTIRNASLSVGPDSGFTVNGSFSIGDDGLIDADLKLTVRDPQGLSAALAEAFPEKRREIRNVSSALSFMGNDPTLPLVIERGAAKIAFFKLGDIPPL